MQCSRSESPVALIKKFINVARDQGGRKAFEKAFRRIQSSIELGAGLMSASLRRFAGLSDRALMRQIDPRWKDLDSFIEHLRTKEAPVFPFSGEAKGDFLAALEQYYPQEVAQTIRDAERICDHEFHMLGEDFVFPGEINWHLDSVTGESWPKQYIEIMEEWFWGGECSRDAYQQTNFLRHNLTLDWEVQNNWLIGQVTALVTVGALFPEFVDSQDWVETGLKLLEREARRQTSSDGVNREQAIGYHRFVLDLLLLVVVLGRRGMVPRSQVIEQVLKSMLEYALYSMDPSGHLSQLGDTDEGWGFRLSERADYWDVRPWLAAGAVLFHHPELKFPCKYFPEEAFWLLGQSGLSEFLEMKERMPCRASSAFYDGGHYVIRDNWTPESDFMIIKSGDFGLGGEGFCAHAHCDLLSFILWIQGRPVVVDSGTYTYRGPWRNYFRLTSAHNTVLIDGKDQAVPINEFFWTQVPKATCECWDGNRIIGNLSVHGVTIRREIYHPVPGSWRIADVLSGQGKHSIEWFFHFAPDISLRWDHSPEHLIVETCGIPYAIITLPQDVEAHIESGWYSPKYGHKERNLVLVATWQGEISNDGICFDWIFQYVGEGE